MTGISTTAGSCPLLDPRAEVFKIESSNVLVRTDESLLQFRGTGVSQLLLSLDGSTDLQFLAATHGSSRIGSVLNRLQQSGLVLWPNGTARRRYPGCQSLPNVLPGPADEQIRIVPTDSYLCPDLRQSLKAAAEAGVPVAVLKQGTSAIWLGPIIQPGCAPCWECFLRRLASRDDHWSLLTRGAWQKRVPVPMYLASRDFVDRASAMAPGILLEISLSSRDTKFHRIVPCPSCSECAAQSESRQVAPSSPPGSMELWNLVEQRAGHLIDPVTGVVAELGLCDGSADSPVKVAVARYADATRGNLCEYALHHATGRVVRSHAVARTSFGAGQTSGDARSRAVLEAFERYCGIFQPGDTAVFAAFSELGDAALHPNCLMNYSAEQLRHPNAAVTDLPRELRVPEPFDENARIHWTPFRSLSGQTRYVPVALCYEGFDRQPDSAFCTFDTSGCAVAFTLEDAIVHAFLELVERDAVAIWWYNRILKPVVQLHTFGDPFIDRVAEQHRALGRELRVFDVTHDLGIPVFAAVSLGAGLVPLFGFGAHFSARRAVVAALMELGQAVCFESQEKKKWAGVDWSLQVHLTTRDLAKRCAADCTEISEKPVVPMCTDALTTAGLELFVRDCTRPDIGLPAVRVIVPGLRHIWPRFGPGRLWDIPVKLGLLKEPTPSRQWNPEHLRS